MEATKLGITAQYLEHQYHVLGAMDYNLMHITSPSILHCFVRLSSTWDVYVGMWVGMRVCGVDV